MGPKWLRDLLELESTDKYHIVYKGYRANHLSHGIVALQRLGATEEQIQKFLISVYTDRLHPKAEFINDDTVKSSAIDDYLGKRSGYYVVREYYDNLLATQYSDVKELLKHELPKIADGMLGSAYHGIIQTGYGYVAGSDKIVCEGLAYSHFAYYAPFPGQRNHVRIQDIGTFGHGKRNLVDIIEDIRNDKKTYDVMLQMAESPDIEEKSKGSTFSKRRIALFQERSDLLFDLTDQINLPKWFDGQNSSTEKVVALGKWIFDQAVKVYVMAENINDFFLLHGVTGAWCMCQMIGLMDSVDAIRVCRTFLATLLAVYIIMDCPPLSRKPEEFFSGDVNEQAWDSVIKASKEKVWEVHILKLIQCCYDMRNESGDDPTMDRFYLAASHVGLNNDFCRIWDQKRALKRDGRDTDD